jgi:hypothetical protein
VNRFRTFARNRQNGFVALGNCFIKVSLTAAAPFFGSEARAARSWAVMAQRDGEMGEGSFLLIRTRELMGRVSPAVEPLLAPDQYSGALAGALALGRPLSPLKTKSLRSHALDVLFERFHLRVAPLVF